MSNNKQIEKKLKLPHRETVISINTIQTKPFDNQKIEIMSNNKQSMEDLLKPISKNVREWLEDIGTTTTIAQPKKTVGWYCLGSKNQLDCVSFRTYSKPNFIKRFFMRTLLDFYWIKETEQ